MNKKLLAVIGFMLFVCSCAFASNIGYSSVHSGFWWMVLSIILDVIGVPIAAGVVGSPLLMDSSSGDKELKNVVTFIAFAVGGCGLFLGYQMFPTVWCGVIGSALGVFTSYSFFCVIFTDFKNSRICSFWFAFLIFAFTISVEAFAFVFLPDAWWLWKYFAITGIGAVCGNVVSLAIQINKKLPIWLVSLMIPEFIAFWIVFANCGMNLASAILLITFAVLLFLTLVSPLILIFVGFVLIKKEAKKRRIEEERERAEKVAEEERKQREERELYIKAKAEADAKEERIQRENEFNRIMKEVCPGTDGHPNPSGEHDFSGGNFCKFCGKRLH